MAYANGSTAHHRTYQPAAAEAMSPTVQSVAVLIIGCGIAGSTTALTLADAGIPVTVVTRARRPEDSNTFWAQGGIIYQGVNDSPALLSEDILRAGAGHCRPQAVKLLAEHGPQAVRRLLLERVGVGFDQTHSGELSLALEGGHTIPRIVHAADATGKAIEIALLNALVAHPQITLLTGHTAIDLVKPTGSGANGIGVYVLDQASGKVLTFYAAKVVLATGGLGQIYPHTTNPKGARGDGLAIAARFGATITDAEFMQFHPTGFYHNGAVHFLVSEAVRGAGARLVHADGQPFMARYDATWRDLAPRDVVARAIHQEMHERQVEQVYLDLRSYVPREEILNHFPNIDKGCRRFGIDMTTDLVPVVPAAHYFCGGVQVDEWGRTDRPHLYAVGETACTGLHGANRLASTSLLEGLVWGERAAHHIQAALNMPIDSRPNTVPLWPGPQEIEHQHSERQHDEQRLTTATRRQRDLFHAVQTVMWDHVGLVRTTSGLATAQVQLAHLQAEIAQCYAAGPLNDAMIGLRNAAQSATLIAAAAAANRRSLGCHYRLEEEALQPLAA